MVNIAALDRQYGIERIAAIANDTSDKDEWRWRMRVILVASMFMFLAFVGGAADAVETSQSAASAAGAATAPAVEQHAAPRGVRLRKGSDSVLIEWGATAETIKSDLAETICSSMGSGKSFCSPDLLEGWCVGFGSAYPATQYFWLYGDHFYEYTVEYEVGAMDEISAAFTNAMGKPISSEHEQVQNAFGAKWSATTTVWKRGDVVVTVTARAEKMDRGRITITNTALTPPKDAPEEAPF